MSNNITPAISGEAMCGQTICGDVGIMSDPYKGFFGNRNLSFSEYGENPKFNLATQRLLYVQPDTSIGANSFAVSVSHIYDSQMNARLCARIIGLPLGWKLDAHQFLILDGKDSKDVPTYKYIDGAGYVHTFERMENSATRYYDTDGLGLTLDCSNSVNPYIVDSQENKMIFENERLKEKVSCHNTAMKKTFEYDANGRLTKIYDNRTLSATQPTTYLLFNYGTGENLRYISAMHQGVEKHRITYGYSNGQLTEVSKTVGNNSKVICKYAYDADRLSLIVDEVRKSAVKVTYSFITINQNYAVMKISNGIIGSDGAFVEKTFMSWSKSYVQTSDLKTYRELQLLNEKGIRTAVHFNGKGRILSTFECDRWTENLNTLTKDIGIELPVSGTANNKTINGHLARTFTRSLSLPGINLSRSGDIDYRYYGCQFWLNHTSLATRLRAKLTYTLNDNNTYSNEVEIDAKAFEAWQQVVIPIDIKSSAKTIFSMVLEISASDHTDVTAKVCNFRFIPSRKTTMYLNSKAPVDFDNFTKFKITTVNYSTGAESTSITNIGVSSDIFFTQNDLMQTIQYMRKTYSVQGKTCFDIVCNNGTKKIANVISLKFIRNVNGTEAETNFGYDFFSSFYNMGGTQIINAFGLRPSVNNTIAIDIASMFFRNDLFSKMYSEIEHTLLADFFIVNTSSDDKSASRQYLCADNNRIGTMAMTAVCKDKNSTLSTTVSDNVQHSANVSFADYKGRNVLDIDVYGVKTSYEYHPDGSAKRSVLTGTDGKQIILAETALDTSGVNAQFVNSVNSGHDSSSFAYKNPYHLIDTETINNYNFSANSYASTNGHYKYTYDIFNEAITRVEAFAGTVSKGYNDITYENGRIKTVSDGKSKYGINYNLAIDEMTFTVYSGETANDVQTHRTSIHDGTTTKTDTFYRGTGTDSVTTKLNKYGQLVQIKEGTRTSTYSYLNTGNESSVANTLLTIYDPYENRTYTKHYDHDWNPIGFSSNHLAIRQLSSTDTKYTFGSNEKYLTRIVYDDSVTIEPRIIGTQLYVDNDTNNNDNFNESNKLSWKYYYDGLGRIESKANKNDSFPDGRYTYTYKTNGARTLPVLDTYKYVGSYYIRSEYTKCDYGFEYTDRGMPKKITESFWKYHGFNPGNMLSDTLIARFNDTRIKEYTYDEFDRIHTETITNNGDVKTNTYHYFADGRLERITYETGNKKIFGYDARGNRVKSFYYNRIGLDEARSNSYEYDNYGNRKERGSVWAYSEGEDGIIIKGSTIYDYTWTRGSCLESVKKSTATVATYSYDRNGVRFRKVAGGVTTNYYTDGHKILGEDRSDGKKLRYFYDAEGVCGFRYYNGSNWKVYTYVKDGMGSIVMIKEEDGLPIVRYTYDSYGNAEMVGLDTRTMTDYTGLVPTILAQMDAPALELGKLNPFRWKGHYYDVECEERNYSGYYYIDGRYYDPNEGLFIDAEPIENMFGNAETVYGLDRHTPTYDNILTMAAYAYAIFTMAGYASDPDGNYTASGTVPWWSWLLAAVQILAGLIMLFTPMAVFGAGLIFSGVVGILGNIFSSQLASGLGMLGTGLQSIITGVMLIVGACNPIATALGWAGTIAGIATTTFATAEIQEGLGNGNWIKDSGMSEGLYNGVMWTSYGISTFVNIAGPIANKYGPKCFAAGTLVLCLGVDGKSCYKPIEEIEVGDKVLAYDEETGEQGYKEVVRLFRNSTLVTHHLSFDDCDESIICTPEHPFYILNTGSNTPIVNFEGRDESKYARQWVQAKYLKVGDKVLLSDGKTAILTKTELEHLSEPITTYNFEVQDFHTYYVGEQGILVHNTCVKSRIHESDALVKEANQLSGRVQSEANDLVGQFAKGNTNPGIGSKHLSGDIYYLRGRNGARVFYNYDVGNDIMYILGKASKANEQKVIGLVLKIFGG